MTADARDKRRHQPRVARFYRTGTLIFLGCSLLVSAAIALTALSATVVTVTLKPHALSESLELTVTENQQNQESELKGTLIFSSTDGELSVDVPSSGARVDDFARGTVTIVNKWTKTQPLAVTTRLRAAANGLIYRTAKFVNVPAGDSVEVEVVADEKGIKGNAPPTEFEIVALWPGLKDKIYGTSRAAFSGGVRTDSTVSPTVIDEAKKRLADQLLKQFPAAAQDLPTGMTSTGAPTLVSSNIVSSAKPGDQVTSFTVKGSVTSLTIAVDGPALNEVVRALLQRIQPANEEYVSAEPSVSWTIQEFNQRQGTARLTMNVRATARLKSDSPTFAASNFSRQTAAEIISKLKGTAGVTAVEAKISPFWASRSPSNPAQIKVRVTATSE